MTESINSIAPGCNKKYQYWSEQIKLKQASGLSRASYCRLHGIVCSQFSYWENKFKSARLEPSPLLPVKLTDNRLVSVPVDTTKCTLTFKSGHELKVHDQSVLPLLLSLLR